MGIRDELVAEVFGGAPKVDVNEGLEQPPQDELDEEEAQPQEEDQPEAEGEAEEAAPEEDPLAGVPAALREKLDAIGSTLEQFTSRLKTTEGRVGAIQSHLAKSAAVDTRKAGDKAPTQAQIDAAKKSDETWKSLKEDFPEWASAMEDKIAAQSADYENKFLSKSEAQAAILTSQKQIQQQIAEQIEKRIVAARHPNYEQTLRTKEFWSWFKTQPEQMKHKAASTKADDAIEILDAYKASLKPTQPNVKEERKKRLERSVSPTGVSEKPIKSEADMTPEELRRHLSKQIWGG
jgi:hypothetical protein